MLILVESNPDAQKREDKMVGWLDSSRLNLADSERLLRTGKELGIAEPLQRSQENSSLRSELRLVIVAIPFEKFRIAQSYS